MRVAAIAAAVAFAMGFCAAWSWQGSVKDAALLAQLQEAQEGVRAAVENARAIRDLRDANYQASLALQAAKQKRDEAHAETVTEIREVYITEDSNAVDCGLSAGGVRVWNTAAAGAGGVPETPSTEPGADDAAIAARNIEVTRAAVVSFRRHWAAIRQVEALQSYIQAECMPVAGR